MLWVGVLDGSGTKLTGVCGPNLDSWQVTLPIAKTKQAQHAIQ
jgi:hypothetical protein